MAQMGILVDREDGSRFSLNYNKQTTENLFRYARTERLFNEGEKLRWCYESEYGDFYQKKMEETKGPRGRQRSRINYDFVVEERTELIDLGLSSGNVLHETQLAPSCLQEEKMSFLNSYGTLLILLDTFVFTFPPNFFPRKSENYNLLQINLSEG